MALGLILLAGVAPSAAYAASTFVVTTSADESDPGDCFAGDGDCSLREAILAANAAGSDVDIEFALSDGLTITPATELPAITANNVLIDARQSGDPIVEINGSSVPAGIGLRLQGTNITVAGLIINRFIGGMAIQATGANATLLGNWIGPDRIGTASYGTPGGSGTAQARGVQSGGTGTGLTVGGPSAADRNVIAGNTFGIQATVSGATIRGNYIGMSRTGLATIPNQSGVSVSGGGAVIGPGNTISGNSILGVELTGGGGNTVIGNYIGLGSDGTTAAGNGSRGIRAVSNNNVIGGPDPSDRNVIGNNNQGIHIREDGNVVQGNWIGIDASGTVARPNSFGIQIEPVATGSNNNTISDNVISGNTYGVYINGTIIGGTAVGNKFYGNLIGANPTGLSAIPNGTGILVTGQGTLIGGQPPLQGNVISGNTGVGVQVAGVLGRATLQNNKIGVSVSGAPLGNGSHGVQFSSAASIASGTSAAFNRIAYNGGAGVFVDGTASNLIVGNSIEANGGLGIDLAPLGVNANDPLDADTGANERQNHPELTSAASTAVDTRISGAYHSEPNIGTIFNVYQSPTCDPSGHGEGATLLGDFYVETDAFGDASFVNKLVSRAPVGTFVTATAYSVGPENSSEFSACVPVTAAPPPAPTCTPNAVAPADGPADLTWDGAGPSTEDSYQSNVCIYRFDERQDFQLPLDVRPAAPRTTNMAVTNPPTRLLEQGRVVSSHLLHADTVGSGVQAGVVLSGTVTFDDPILGVIMGRDLMVATDAAVNPSDLTYEAAYSLRGLEFNTADVVRVSATDPRTLEVTFAVNALDEIRVFTGQDTGPTCAPTPGNAVVFATGSANVTLNGDVESDDCIFLFEEQPAVVLTENLLPAAPKTTNMARTAPPTRLLPAGTRLSSYLLHMDVEGTSGRTLSGSYTFDEPILGVFMGRNRMVETDGLTGLPGMTYESAHLPRGLEFDTTDVVRVRSGDPYTLEVTFSTNTMDEIRVFTGVSVAEAFSGNVVAGGTVTTDTEGDGAVLAAGDTIETTIISPNAGPVIIEESIGTPASGDLSIYGFTVDITAPTASVANPLVLRFRLDSSVFDPAWSLSTLAVNRNGLRVANCTASGAIPNPCVESRFRHADGDAEIVIRTSAASTWEIGRAAPDADAGGPYTAVEGSALALSGSATGDGPFTYQWLGDTTSLSDLMSATPIVETVDDGDLDLELEATDALGFGARSATTVTVTNAAPVVGAVAGPVAPVAIGGSVAIDAPFSDSGVMDTHTAAIDWGDGTTSAATINQGSGQASGGHVYAAPGVYTVTVTVTDDDGDSGAATYRFAVIYDATGAFVTGGGWIDSPAGAYRPHPAAFGKATFGFMSKYAKGATVPTGQTVFKFNAGDFDFRSDSQQWLVVNQGGTNAQFKGVGTVNGNGSYSFMVWATDGASDTFRIKVWQDTGLGEVVVYDTGTGLALGGGSIIVHKAK